jgi:hypothetical protein
MPALALGMNSYERVARYGARTKLFNMYLEQDPTNEVDGLMRLQRPGLVEDETFSVGDGPMRGMVFRGVAPPVYFAVMGTELWGGTRPAYQMIGTIPGSEPVRMALSATALAIVTNVGDAYIYTVSLGVIPVFLPDSLAVEDVTYLNGYFLLQARASNRVYWIEPGETAVDALNFFSAEYDSDIGFGIRAFGEQLWVFQRRTTEVWASTGDADAPFQRIPGRTLSTGCFDQNTIVQVGESLVWVSSHRQVVAWMGGLKTLSHNGIDELLRPQGTAKAWGYSLSGHWNYVLTAGTGETMVADLSMMMGGVPVWSEYGTVGRTGWQAHLGIDGTEVWAGDDIEAKVWQLDPEINTDDDEPFVREISGRATVLGKPICNASVEIVMNTGFAPSLIDDDELLYRYSDDDGNTWTDWDSESVGATGQYGGVVTLRRQGLIEPPGRTYELRYTADAPFRVSYARLGEAAITKPRAA